MSTALIPVLVLLAGAVGSAWGQGIYSCVDARGRRLTADRPIAECMDREQRQLNPTGTVQRIIPPAMTAVERAAHDERQRKVLEEQKRQAEEKRMQRALLVRYPNAAAHDAERAKALRSQQESAQAAQQSMATREDELKRINRRFDDELARLKVLWAQGTTAVSPTAAPAMR